MSGLWLALAGFFTVTAAPSSRGLRLAQLVRGGRLATTRRRPLLRGALPAGSRWARATPRGAGSGRPELGAPTDPWRGTTRAARGLAVGAALAGGSAVAAVFARAGPALACAAAALVAVGARLVWDVRNRRAAARLDAAALGALRVLIGELRAGSAPVDALGAAAQAAPLVAVAYESAAELARRGEPAGPALLGAEHPAVRVVGAAWAVGAATGAALSDVLARVATDIEASAAQRRATAVALAGPRSSAAVLAGLPVLGVGLGSAMGAHPLPFLLADPAGRLACCAGVLLDAAGVLWVRAILRRSEAAP